MTYTNAYIIVYQSEYAVYQVSTIRMDKGDKALLKRVQEALSELTGMTLTQGKVIKLLVLFGEHHLSQLVEFLKDNRSLLDYSQETFWNPDQLRFDMRYTDETTHNQRVYRNDGP